ncbi:MAG: hypothetical protein WBC48_02165 [Minisyncoccales bacterium]
MNKNIILGVAAVAVAGAGIAGYLILNKNGGGGGTEIAGGDCAAICAKVSVACPSMANKEICLQNCPGFDEKTKNDAGAIASCEMLAQKPELLALLAISEVKDPELAPAKNDCEAACNNYVGKCLTLVPNAGQELFSEGLSSCLKECAGWETVKVSCMVSAADCPAMTETCGL